jgi:hypothetical protein
MKKVFILIALMFILGFPNLILFLTVFQHTHSVWLVFTSFGSAFIGTGIIYGFSDFSDEPRFIGNIDNNYTKPRINQNWAIFFISLVINLTVANFCDNV